MIYAKQLLLLPYLHQVLAIVMIHLLGWCDLRPVWPVALGNLALLLKALKETASASLNVLPDIFQIIRSYVSYAYHYARHVKPILQFVFPVYQEDCQDHHATLLAQQDIIFPTQFLPILVSSLNRKIRINKLLQQRYVELLDSSLSLSLFAALLDEKLNCCLWKKNLLNFIIQPQQKIKQQCITIMCIIIQQMMNSKSLKAQIIKMRMNIMEQ